MMIILTEKSDLKKKNIERFHSFSFFLYINFFIIDQLTWLQAFQTCKFRLICTWSSFLRMVASSMLLKGEWSWDTLL